MHQETADLACWAVDAGCPRPEKLVRSDPMIEVASAVPLPVGVLAWPGHGGAATIVVKASFDLFPDGSIALSQRQQPLSLDVRAVDGTLVYPCDFAPYKPACEVIVVGEEARTADSASLTVGHAGATARHLGPITAHDPRDPGWSAADFNFVRFQSAEPAQRFLKLPLPTQLSFTRGAVACSQIVNLPAPSLAIFDRGTGDVRDEDPLYVTLACDTLLLDPRARTLIALFRGYAEPQNGWRQSTLIAMNLSGTFNGIERSAMARWPLARATRFDDLLGAAAPPSDDDAASGDDDMSSTLQARESPARAAAGQTPGGYDGRETVAIVACPPASTLPFVAGRFQPDRSARVEPRKPQGDPLADEPIGSGTLPFNQQSPVHAFLAARAASTTASSSAPQAPHAGLPTSQTMPLPLLTREQLERIQGELLAAPRSRRDILARYGLSEMVWAAIVSQGTR